MFSHASHRIGFTFITALTCHSSFESNGIKSIKQATWCQSCDFSFIKPNYIAFIITMNSTLPTPTVMKVEGNLAENWKFF